MTPRRAILLAIILIGFFLRTWRLPQTPPGLWYDEAYNAMDAIWMAKTGDYPLFFVGNNGREPMWHYLLLLSTSLLGNTTFAERWVASLAGVLTIPLLYRLALLLLRPFAQNNSGRRWLTLLAAGWLAVSWWHLHHSRAGFRSVLLPPILMLSLYFWMQGRRQVTSGRVPSYSTLSFVLAGFFLGLSQYTYLPARLTVLIFIGLFIIWAFQSRVSNNGSQLPSVDRGPFIKQLCFGFLVTVGTAAIVAAPLGLFFLVNPEILSARTADVIFLPGSFAELANHVWQSVSLFFGAGHELYRHHLPGRAMLGWLEIPFFWLGLIWLLHPRRLRLPEVQLLLLGLSVMWLPTLLASPPVHSLRPIGLLPFFYLIVTLGLFYGWRLFLTARKLSLSTSRFTFYALPLALIALNGLINSYDYFLRWADHPEVYQEYNGPLVDLTQQLIELTETRQVIIPFHVYVHPTTRYLLWYAFPEKEGLPPSSDRPVEMLLVPSAFQLLYVGNIPESSALVMLTRDPIGQSAAYVSRPPRAAEQTQINDLLSSEQSHLKSFTDRLGRDVAQFISLPARNIQPIRTLFKTAPLRAINLKWTNLVRLKGYDLTPSVIRPGQPLTLNLYWQSLTDQTFDYRLFLQLIDGTGQPINQWEGEAFREDMYRWRPDGLLPTQHTLWVGPDTPPGPYLVRMGFFDAATGQRLPLQAGENGSSAGHQVELGLFYVSAAGTDPHQPARPLKATFGDTIKLIGVTLPDIQHSSLSSHHSPLTVTFHWQALGPTDLPYTVFLQLLDEQSNLVQGWDRQPFNGLYPTQRWSPGEVVVDTFHMPLPEAGLVPGRYRLITGFYEAETGQRLRRGDGSDFAELLTFEVE